MNHTRPATVQDALRVAANIRKEDRREIEGLGHTPLALVWCVETSAHATAFFNREGELSGIAGIGHDDREGVGQVWMICTPAVEKNPVTFVRQAKLWLAEVGKDYQLLWNVMDSRNKLHRKAVKMLGFHSLAYVTPPPYHLPYIEIVKLCASQQPEPAQRR